MHTSALVLFSGGQDSTTCLAWSLARYALVETIGFDYGQRHRIEIDARQRVLAELRAQFPSWRERLGEDHVIDLRVLSEISETALTRDMDITLSKSGLPNTFVPGRNIMFLTVAAAVAYRRGLQVLVGGMCETDYSGYPDCRDDTLKALQVALGLGLDRRICIETPLMWIDKAQTWEMAYELGRQPLVDLIIGQTHTCYLGERGDAHAWGYGCGQCPACELRRRGYEAWSKR
ncbi:MAG TPA: 7-cyano-7-deazaguanine synthase QueC [Burkholderiales bacterium]|nr:7-cyano-7-deazaguanine synthase QueC [Burkholderiales bacterium]